MSIGSIAGQPTEVRKTIIVALGWSYRVAAKRQLGCHR